MSSPIVLKNSIIEKNFYQPRNSRYKAAIHYLSFGLSCCFPKISPIIMITGYPKSGTVWVTKMVSDYLQLPFIDLSYFPPGCPSVIHGHRRVRNWGPRMIYVVRDGRDCMVSMYFYLARMLEEGDSPYIPKSLARYFKGLRNKNDVKEFLPTFIERQFKDPLGAHLNWQEHIESYQSSSRIDVPLVKYEALLQDCRSALKELFRVLDKNIILDEELLEFTIRKFSFTKQTGRFQGEEEQSSFQRKGVQGDWLQYFTKESAEVFRELSGSALVDLGYEESNDWIGQYY